MHQHPQPESETGDFTTDTPKPARSPGVCGRKGSSDIFFFSWKIMKGKKGAYGLIITLNAPHLDVWMFLPGFQMVI